LRWLLSVDPSPFPSPCYGVRLRCWSRARDAWCS
jgi:hypothetical protein